MAVNLPQEGFSLVALLLGNGDGTLKSPIAYRTGAGPLGFQVADVNLDEKWDFVTANFTADTVSVLLNNGDGTFAPHRDFPTGRDPYRLAVGDVNGDDKPDIATVMKTEIISIGTELTSGQNLDTNCQWLSQRLAEMGIAAGWHTTVADDLDDNVDVFRTAARRADLIISTGGLGPTQDDLTRDALASAAGVELVLHHESLDRIRGMFSSRGRAMPERNIVQAMFPMGAEPIRNDQGTAPGIWMQIGNAVVIAMPGVPSEYRRAAPIGHLRRTLFPQAA